MEKSKNGSLRGKEGACAQTVQAQKKLLTPEEMLACLKKENPKNLVAALQQYLSDEK